MRVENYYKGNKAALELNRKIEKELDQNHGQLSNSTIDQFTKLHAEKKQVRVAKDIRSGAWADDYAISATTKVLPIKINIFHGSEDEPVLYKSFFDETKSDSSELETINLFHTGNHFKAYFPYEDKLIDVQGNGDCFYLAVNKALKKNNQSVKPISEIGTFRNKVADKVLKQASSFFES